MRTYIYICKNIKKWVVTNVSFFFLFLDCAGSEGQTAFTAEGKASVDKTTLLSRRLEQDVLIQDYHHSV